MIHLLDMKAIRPLTSYELSSLSITILKMDETFFHNTSPSWKYSTMR